MIKVIFPTLMLLGSIGLFVFFTNPTYTALQNANKTSDAYDQALNNSKELLKVRNDLTEKYNNLARSDRDRLLKLMPDNVDNIRLIIDIENIALKYGMKPKDVKYDARTAKAAVGQIQPATPEESIRSQKDYGSFQLEFSVTGTYQNFLNFIKDIEKSLRLVDIESISFQSSDSGNTALKYSVRIKTYWLKN